MFYTMYIALKNLRYHNIKVLNNELYHILIVAQSCILSPNSTFSSLLMNIWFVLLLKASAEVNIFFVRISVNSYF